MTRRLALTLAALALIAPTQADAAPPPPGDISSNVTFLTNIPEATTAIAIAFIGNTMFVSKVNGLASYDVANPAAPKLLGLLPMYIWENEDMDVDIVRKLVFISRDPRGFTTQATPGSTFPYGMLHVIDVANPAVMIQKSQFLLPAGHTSTCVEKCRWIWTGGPGANAQTQPTTWGGRPIFATDLTDAANPKACPRPLNLGNNDGVTDYSHDVQVDPRGIAWVSSRGGVHGYWTSGKHRDPVDGKVKVADGCSPIPYGGGGTSEDATPSRFMHNSYRNPKLRIGKRAGDVLMVTEENITSSCETSGRFATYDLRGTYEGQGFRNTSKTKQRMTPLSTWTPEDKEGATGCESAHYFTDRGDGIQAIAFYGQGTRFLDATNPRNIRQVGYFRPDDASTWAAYWRPNGIVFIADRTRGVDIVKFAGKPGRTPTLTAPLRAPVDRPIRFRPSREWGWLCPARNG